MIAFRFRTASLIAGVLVLCASTSGCQSNPWGHWNEALKGSGFPAWSESLGAGARGNNPEAQPSGFFTNRKSEQIEQNLGGGF
jgi:hypothetical protein